jgi:hypothetical protein
MARLIGKKDAFWLPNATGARNGTAVGNATASAAVELSNHIENLAIFVTSTAAVTVKVQVGHHGDLTSEGVEADAAPTVWHDLYYTGSAAGNLQGVALASAGSAALMIPDLSWRWVRLMTTTAGPADLTAGWSGKGE